jgi:PRC-barrel domain protein
MPELTDAEHATTARETTPLPLGWPVLGSDGPLGRLTDVVVDPDGRRVTHLVVEDRQGDARLVPADRLVQGRSPGRVVVLSCSGDDLASLDSIRSFSMLSASEPPTVTRPRSASRTSWSCRGSAAPSSASTARSS